MNSTQLQGRLAQDPRYTESEADNNKDRTWFVMAVGRTGSDDADFIPCVCWGKLARAVATYCKKGKQVTLQGSIRSRMHEGQSRMEVRAHNVIFGPDAKKGQVPGDASDGNGVEKLKELISGMVGAALAEKLGTPAKESHEVSNEATTDDCPL